ncbi:sensor histidine kinase [Sphaerisporangium album]|uniref:histidine kinase n=1 Tax=Sphaerisporangium album TaxID=509200 RepID=A0A367FKZ0_9ACTN|nr:HAMP domain-containing sensor histidine kinase [Sphaerisporangium album]RCG30559.1 sensor histidine kinase [Sphaerisporangium album]
MRRRIAVVFRSLIALTLVCLAVPFAISTARNNTQRLVLDRQSDTEHFAQMAGTALSGERGGLAQELARYQNLYGVRTLVVARDGLVVASSSADRSLGPGMAEQATAALFGERATSGEIVWPWDSRPYVVAIPVFVGGECVGAALTVSPTKELRTRILDQWTVLLLVGVGVIVLAGIMVEPVIRWILRPVRTLHRAATSIAAGELTARAEPCSGPPELRSLAEAFNTMGDTIERLIARQRVFVAHASHQLRTPLAVLHLQLEELGYVHPPAAPGLGICVEEVDRLSRVCEGLLAFGRAESDSVLLCREDVGTVVRERVSAWRSLAARRGVRLERRGEASLTAESSEGMLAQVLDALIDNAIKFSGRGGTVTVHVGDEDGWAEARVVDDGPGLPAEARAKATEPFWRGRDSQNIDGTGLGLTICATLVTRAGGRFDLLEAFPRGLEARVRLRRVAAGGAEAVPAVEGES